LKEADDPEIQQTGTYKRLLRIAMNFRFVILAYKPKIVEMNKKIVEQSKTIEMLKKSKMILYSIIEEKQQQEQVKMIKRSAASKKAWVTRRQKENDAKEAILATIARERREMEKFMAPDPDDEDAHIYEDGIGNSDDDIWGLEVRLPRCTTLPRNKKFLIFEARV
jgi:seryl-tRNA synthetase